MVDSRQGDNVMTPELVKAIRLRIYVGEANRYQHHVLYHAIVMKAREMGLAGATVFRALEGFGPVTKFHSANFLDLSGDLPVVIEIIDHSGRIDDFLNAVGEMIDHGLITTEAVSVYIYGKGTNLPD